MAFSPKTWKDRISEYPNRRTLTYTDDTTAIATVARNEGEITEAGDLFDADNMNDLEERIESGLDGKADLDANSKVKAEQISSLPVTTSASKTLALADAGVGLYCDNAAAVTITIPTNASVAFPIGAEIEIYRAGAGGVTIAAASGVTIQCSDIARTIADQYTSVFLKQWAVDVWALQGNVG